jgi:hypothetical protein
MTHDADTEIAWAAGLFEGEGTVGVTTPKGSSRPYPQASLRMTDEDVVERFCEAVGVGYVGTPVRGTRKPLYPWVANGWERVSQLHDLLVPYLGIRRLEQFERVLTLRQEPYDPGARRREATHCSRGHAWTPENTYMTREGARSCRTCKRAAARRRRSHAA